MLANLVIIHSLVGKIDLDNLFWFYFPKIVITIFTWIGLYGYAYSEGLYILRDRLVLNNYDPNSIGIRLLEVFLKYLLTNFRDFISYRYLSIVYMAYIMVFNQ